MKNHSNNPIHEKKEYTRDEIVKIYFNTQKYGGSFMRAIGEALVRADSVNSKKLINAFSEEFDKYLKL